MLVNALQGAEAANYQRDGQTCPYTERSKESYGTYDNQAFDNEVHPSSDPKLKEPPLRVSACDMDRYDRREDSDDYSQTENLFAIMSADQKNQVARNIADSLGGARNVIQERMISHFEKANPEFGEMVKNALGK